MDNRAWALVLLSLMPIVTADVLVPLSITALPFFPLIVIVEFVLFWLLARKAFNIRIKYRDILLVVILANLVTSFVGIFIQTYGDLAGTLLVSFILSVIMEFAVFVLFFRFYLKKNEKEARLCDLFLASLAVNLASYVGYLLLLLVL